MFHIKYQRGGVTIVEGKNEMGGCMQKRAVSDWTACSNKRLKKDVYDIPSAVKSWKMFANNDIKFSERLPDMFRVLKEWTHCYLMINSRNLKELQTEAEKVGFKLQNILIWDKGNVTPNKWYMQWAEFILMLRKWPAKPINDMWTSNIIRVPNIIWKKRHPTEKPTRLIAVMLKNSTNEWDIVLDPFCWAWWCMVAAKHYKRKFIGIDIDETYTKITEERLLNMDKKE